MERTRKQMRIAPRMILILKWMSLRISPHINSAQMRLPTAIYTQRSFVAILNNKSPCKLFPGIKLRTVFCMKLIYLRYKPLLAAFHSSDFWINFRTSNFTETVTTTKNAQNSFFFCKDCCFCSFQVRENTFPHSFSSFCSLVFWSNF